MNVLILGDGEEERAWALWLIARPEHRLDAAYPGFPDPALAGIPAARDLEDALARPGLDAVIVGGPIATRGESLRRAAGEGFGIIGLHPPGPDSEAYYQVALSREETGATIVPDLPLRLHPGVKALREALSAGTLGSFRGLSFETPPSSPGASLVRVDFARAVDVVRAVIGEIDALTATGDPPGEDPDVELVVHLRGAGTLRAEVRIRTDTHGSTRLTLTGAIGSLCLEIDPGPEPEARLLRHEGGHAAEPLDFPGWDSREAILAVLASSMGRRDTAEQPAPEPAGRHPRDGAVRGGQSQPAPRPDGRDALRVDQRGRDLQVDHDVDRLPGLLRLAAGLTHRDGRAAARHEMDALHPLPDPAGARPLRRPPDAPPGDPAATEYRYR